MQALPDTDERASQAVAVHNRDGKGGYVLLCDHASNRLPARYGSLGLSPEQLTAHIAWDPGALGVSLRLSQRLDAPLVHPTLSRLLADCNRTPEARDLAPETSETTTVPGNRNLSPDERAERIAMVHTPYHAAIETLLDERESRGLATRLIAVHTFTPVYKGIARPWAIGVLSNRDRRLAEYLIDALRAEYGAQVGDNEPYAPSDGVYYTLTRHGEARGLACAMLEIRNDEVADAAGEAAWAARLGPILAVADEALAPRGAEDRTN